MSCWQQLNIDANVCDPIGAREHLRDVACGSGAICAQICAEIDRRIAAQSKDRAVARAGNFQLAFRVARVIGREQMFAPIFDPFNRAVELARRKRDQKIFRIIPPRTPNPLALHPAPP